MGSLIKTSEEKFLGKKGSASYGCQDPRVFSRNTLLFKEQEKNNYLVSLASIHSSRLGWQQQFRIPHKLR